MRSFSILFSLTTIVPDPTRLMKRKTRAKPEPQVAEPAEPQASTEPEQEILVYGLPKKHAKVRGRRGASKIKRAGREERASSLLIANN